MGVLTAFMSLDRTTLHWYSREPGQTTGVPTLQPIASATPNTRLSAFEAQLLAVRSVRQSFGGPDQWSCAEPQFNDRRMRWATICTGVNPNQSNDNVIVVGVDDATGEARPLDH